MLYLSIPCYTVLYRAIPCYTLLYRAIPRCAVPQAELNGDVRDRELKGGKTEKVISVDFYLDQALSIWQDREDNRMTEQAQRLRAIFTEADDDGSNTYDAIETAGSTRLCRVRSVLLSTSPHVGMSS